LKSYRNQKGLFIHFSKNIKVVGGIFADNREGLEIDRADNIDVQDATFIGVSQSYRDLMESQGVKNACRQGRVVGLEHHTWKNDPELDGSSVKNLTFTGFTETGCPVAQAIHVDDRVSGLACCTNTCVSVVVVSHASLFLRISESGPSL
jgi:hypothetical protein